MRQRLIGAEADAQRLRDAIRVLEAGDSPKPVNGHRTRENATAAKVAAEPTEAVPLGKLIEMINEQDGRSATELSRETGGDQKAILALLKEAEADGKLVRTGQRRATRWHLTNGA
jgi:hypothetical protein